MRHYSGCAVHNMPAYDAGPCDCGGFFDTDEIFEDRRRREQERQMDQATEERAKQAEEQEKRGAVIGAAIGKTWKP